MSSANLQATKHLYEFGPFRIDVGERLLFRDGAPVPLTPKAFDTLLALVEAPGHIFEKDDLMRRVWPDTIVEENNLTQNISSLRKALGQNPDERLYIETIPRRGYRFIATVRERWEEIPELIVRERTKSTVIVEEEEETETQTKVLGGLSMAQLTMVSAIVLLTVASAVYYVHASRQTGETGRSSLAGAGLRRRPAVAVLELRNLTGRSDSAWLSTALSEMLTSELAAGAQLRAIPGENIARMRMDLTLGNADGLAGDTLARIRNTLGTDYVVLGSFTDLGPQDGGRIHLDLRLQDARAGETLAAFGESGTESKLFDLVSQAGAHLRDALGVGDVPAPEAGGVRAELPSNPQVAKLYADGLASLRVFNPLQARELLEKAVAADPQFPLAHSALASAFSGLGYDAKAREEAKKAFDLAGGLNREERLVIEGRYRAVSNQWNQALEVYRTLFGLFPDNLDYGINLMTAEGMVGSGNDLQATLASLRQLPPPVGQDARIDLAEANWAESVSDFKREHSAASRAVDRGLSLGESLLVGQAQLAQATAQWKLGQPQEALATLSGAQTTFESKGDRASVAEATEITAHVLRDRGDLTAARQKYEQALEIRRATGDEGGVAASLNDLALLKWQQADLGGARQMYDEALASLREVGDQSGVANALNNIANIFYDQGDLEAARRMYNDSTAKFGEIGDKGGMAQELLNVGLVLLNQGDLAGARQRYQQAAEIANALGTRSQLASALAGLGDVAYSQGDLTQARRNYEQALAIRRQLGEQGNAAETAVELATVTIEEGQPEQAVSLLSPAIEEARREGQAADEAEGEAALSRAFLEQRNLAEAVKASDRARPLAEKGQSQPVRLDVEIISARVRAGSGDAQQFKEAQERLAAARAEALKFGFVDRALDAGLALGQVELSGGDAPAGRLLLARVEADAQQKGFGLVAHKAQRALKQ